ATGLFDVVLADQTDATQGYVGNTAILTTTLTDASGGAVRITDLAPRFKQYGRIFRPTMLMRRIEPVAGTPPNRIRPRPSFDYGAMAPTGPSGSNHTRFLSPPLALRLTTDAPISYIAEETSFLLAGPVNLILGADEPFHANVAETAREFRERTEDYWQDW